MTHFVLDATRGAAPRVDSLGVVPSDPQPPYVTEAVPDMTASTRRLRRRPLCHPDQQIYQGSLRPCIACLITRASDSSSTESVDLRLILPLPVLLSGFSLLNPER